MAETFVGELPRTPGFSCDVILWKNQSAGSFRTLRYHNRLKRPTAFVPRKS